MTSSSDRRPPFPESPISFKEARARLALLPASPGTEPSSLQDSLARVLAEPLNALVDRPKHPQCGVDGFALRKLDLAPDDDSGERALPIAGRCLAGDPLARLPEAQCMRVTTGALLPQGADLVLPDELARVERDTLFPTISRAALQAGLETTALQGQFPPPRMWIQPAASQLRRGAPMASPGQLLDPLLLSRLSWAGHASALVYKRPRVLLIATGSELHAPSGLSRLTPVEGGECEPHGELPASNLILLATAIEGAGATLTGLHLLRDDPAALQRSLEPGTDPDLILTVGGSRGSEGDHVLRVLTSLGWKPSFQGLRMRPGGDTSAGLLRERPVFVLPGGPSGAWAAFLALVLPVLHALSGRASDTGSLRLPLAAALESSPRSARLLPARLRSDAQGGATMVEALPDRSVESSPILLLLPEGAGRLEAGAAVSVLGT